MTDGNLVGSIDVAELALGAFALFFLVLVIWLQRESRREGYPLEDEISGRVESMAGPFLMAPRKFYRLPFDRGVAVQPVGRLENRDPVDIAARRLEHSAGSPYVPTGNPLVDGIGPAAYANRAKWPDQDANGRPRIVPMTVEHEITIAPKSRDPRGMLVIAADREKAGTITDLWVDRSEHVIRYLEVATPTGGKALVPMPMAKIIGNRVHVSAINAADYDASPFPATPGEITRYEEERVMGYFGGGYLYANAGRQEPLI